MFFSFFALYIIISPLRTALRVTQRIDGETVSDRFEFKKLLIEVVSLQNTFLLKYQGSMHPDWFINTDRSMAFVVNVSDLGLERSRTASIHRCGP